MFIDIRTRDRVKIGEGKPKDSFAGHFARTIPFEILRGLEWKKFVNLLRSLFSASASLFVFSDNPPHIFNCFPFPPQDLKGNSLSDATVFQFIQQSFSRKSITVLLILSHIVSNHSKPILYILVNYQ